VASAFAVPARRARDGRGDATQQSASALAVFRNRPFLIVWLSQLATQVGGNMVLYGLTVLIFTHRAPTARCRSCSSASCPAVIFGALAGVYVDRFDRRLVLVATSLIRAGLFLLVAISTRTSASSSCSTWRSRSPRPSSPAELSMIPAPGAPGQLIRGNGSSRSRSTRHSPWVHAAGALVVTIAARRR